MGLFKKRKPHYVAQCHMDDVDTWGHSRDKKKESEYDLPVIQICQRLYKDHDLGMTSTADCINEEVTSNN